MPAPDKNLTCAKCQRDLPPRKSRMTIAVRDGPRLCRSCSIRRHGLTGSRIHHIWSGMMQRCGHFAGAKAYDLKVYADRGISVCEAWRSLETFANWAAANGYAETLEIHRRENDLGYGPDNCEWITKRDNLRQRRTAKLTLEGAGDIRIRVKRGESFKEIAASAQVSLTTVYDIASDRTWRI